MAAHAVTFFERFLVSFHRTLRVPNDGRPYPLPPGLGPFPLFRVSDYRERVPEDWLKRAGLFLPMYQREALWIGFRGRGRPCAVQVTVGGVNTLTGAVEHAPSLSASPQNYLVCPPQLWLDGVRTRRGQVRQFVAVPLGRGETLEAALTGGEVRGGLTLSVYPARPELLPAVSEQKTERTTPQRMTGAAMGFGAGGAVAQKVYPDPYGLQVWDQEQAQSLEVHVLNSLEFQRVTGMAPPPTPLDAETYSKHKLPWFSLYDDEQADVSASATLTEVAEALQPASTQQSSLRIEDLNVQSISER